MCSFITLEVIGKNLQPGGKHPPPVLVHVPNFGGLSGLEDRDGGDNSIQVINSGRVGDKSFEEWQQKIGEWKGG